MGEMNVLQVTGLKGGRREVLADESGRMWKSAEEGKQMRKK